MNSRVSHAIVRSQHVFDRHFDIAGLAFISDSHAQELRNAEVQSGDVLLPITVEQMQTFTAPMYNRNPKLQFAFGGTKLVEGRGFGMRTFGEAAAKHGLPVPQYAFDGLYLNLTIYRHVRAAVDALGAVVLGKLSKSERSGWEWLATQGSAKSSEYAAAMKLPYRTAMNHLKKFHKFGLLERTGSARATEYRVRKP